MKEKLKSYLEPNQRIRTAETIALVMLLLGSLFSYVRGTASLHKDPGELTYIETTTLARDFDAEDYDEDSTSCDVIFANEEGQLIKTYTYEDYENLKDESIDAYVYETDDGIKLFFDHKDPNPDVIKGVYRQTMATALMPVFNLANALIILAASVAVMLFYGKFFTAYEKSWFLGIMVLATIFAVLFPEESANGVNGIWIMLLYLLDTFLNILCELLISKQSRYNFLVSVLVEITEIIISIVLMYRFATMTVTLLFWLPIDILSFINWTRHKDDKEEELTVVRRLKGYQEVLVILAIGVWTVVVGYFISGLDIRTDFLGNNKQLETIMIYLDACASAVGIANGLFIFFRLREQWIAWYICALLEAIMNILAGQYVLLVLKLGYFTNTTYGYIKWSRYIGTHKEEKASIL
ncbi:MAG: nicotinamide mononucleotide transporter [Erysipelotrichaceae bacterium]|nr:nicotinamide mononucleotide transporter [Erysipelotrichaceae bacterium]MBQ2078718.1 nicotinamide mononucleotide transporter [Erysipelotrichaceae bacterium]